jgi:hypothetical protein
MIFAEGTRAALISVKFTGIGGIALNDLGSRLTFHDRTSRFAG